MAMYRCTPADYPLELFLKQTDLRVNEGYTSEFRANSALLILTEPGQMFLLIFTEFPGECLGPCGGLFDGCFQRAVFIGYFVPVLMFGIGVLEHPGRTPSLLLQDHGYALGGLGDVGDFRTNGPRAPCSR
jgi:hypothetical protein